MTDLFMKRAATYSACGKYRWTLERDWSNGQPSRRCCYIGHNPSDAGHDRDDPTSMAWVDLAKANGFNGYVAVNLYPYRTPDVAACRRWADYEKNGPDWYARDALMHNETVVATEAKRASRVVACWGALALDLMWVDHIAEAVMYGVEPWPDLYCFGTTNSGAPKHAMARGKHRVARNQQFYIWRSTEAGKQVAA